MSRWLRDIPRFGSLGTESGDVSFGRVGSIAVQVADDGVDLNDDVLEMRILFNGLNKNI